MLKNISQMLAMLLVVYSSLAVAVIEIAPLSNEALEERYRELIEELRCPKCQNQNLADSNSPIAADLREQVRVLLEEGKSDDEVVNYLVERYGDFVRYRPAVKGNTLVLWFAPLVLLVVVVFAAIWVVRLYRRPQQESTVLSEAEKQQLQQLIKATDQSGDKAK